MKVKDQGDEILGLDFVFVGYNNTDLNFSFIYLYVIFKRSILRNQYLSYMKL